MCSATPPSNPLVAGSDFGVYTWLHSVVDEAISLEEIAQLKRVPKIYTRGNGEGEEGSTLDT